jgi:hypothetical protein
MQPSEFVPQDASPSLENPQIPAHTPAWSGRRWSLLLAALTFATFLVHGYHPLAEDGGLNAAGIEFILNPALFPHFRVFVTQHLHLSAFASAMAAFVHLTHLSLLAALLLVDLGSIALMLIAARALLRRVVLSEPAQLAGIALLAALWTLPIAATSLMLMDPYVTARSLSTPLSLVALAFALDPWPSDRAATSQRTWHSLAGCIITLGLTFLFHPLMAGYALGLILILRLLRQRRPVYGITLLLVSTLVLAAILQALAPSESPSVVAASFTRYYWFLSQWHWYELLGLAGPLLVLALFLRSRAFLREPGVLLCRAALLLGPLAVAVALLFAHESYRTHLVAHLQPLRAFLLLYVIMVLLLGAALQQIACRIAARLHNAPLQRLVALLPALLIATTAAGMFAVQRAEFSSSNHLELPWRLHRSPNPWVQAFLWCRAHAPTSALFALDAHYITFHGEDAQTFRAISERSALPDYSKDGGEAADTPALADRWATGVAAQLNLSHESDAIRIARLQPLNVDWVVLLSSAVTALPCPYDNGAVKVCRLSVR